MTRTKGWNLWLLFQFQKHKLFKGGRHGWPFLGDPKNSLNTNIILEDNKVIEFMFMLYKLLEFFGSSLLWTLLNSVVSYRLVDDPDAWTDA